MNKHLRIFLYAAMISAILMIVVCSVNYLDLGKQLRSTNAQLSESRTAWQGVAAEKEALQEELETKQSDLKEAELSLNEATARTEEIRAEIEALQKEIDSLRSGAD